MAGFKGRDVKNNTFLKDEWMIWFLPLETGSNARSCLPQKYNQKKKMER